MVNIEQYRVLRNTLCCIFLRACYIALMTKQSTTSKAFRFSDEELALLERLKDRHGSYKAAVMAGLHQIEGRNQPTNKDLIEMLKARLG